MTINGIEHGISYLPENCLPYAHGYRYGAYTRDAATGELLRITEFFKTTDEIYEFVMSNPSYGNGKMIGADG